MNLKEWKSLISINFPLFGRSRKGERKKNILIGPTKIVQVPNKREESFRPMNFLILSQICLFCCVNTC